MAATAAVGACGDYQLVRIIAATDPSAGYLTQDVNLGTLEDLGRVRGSVAELFGGAELRVDPTTFVPTDRGAGRAQLVDHPSVVDADWLVDGSVAVATDFESLAMFTVYAHLETASRHFAALGVGSASDRVPVYFHPTLRDAESIGLANHDNAAYWTEGDAFFFLPMEILQEIPFPMNAGVVAHEYAHRVWYYELWDGRLFETRARLAATATQNDWNRLRATDEGVADYFGAVVASDPAFLRQSVTPAIGDPRDLSVARTLDGAWLNGLQPQVAGTTVYDPYGVGAVVAGALWEIGSTIGHDALQAAIIAAERALQPQITGSLTYDIGDLELAIIAALDPADVAAACTEFRRAYAAINSTFNGACP